jgi:hypothetical protein
VKDIVIHFTQFIAHIHSSLQGRANGADASMIPQAIQFQNFMDTNFFFTTMMQDICFAKCGNFILGESKDSTVKLLRYVNRKLTLAHILYLKRWSSELLRHVWQLHNTTSAENLRKNNVNLSKFLGSILRSYFHARDKFSKVLLWLVGTPKTRAVVTLQVGLPLRKHKIPSVGISFVVSAPPPLLTQIM